MTALHCLLYVCKLLIIYLSPFTLQRMQYLYLCVRSKIKLLQFISSLLFIFKFVIYILLIGKYETKKNLSHVNFISSDAGERLLLFFEDITEIRDPYYLDHIIKEQNLCEKFSSELNSKVNAQKADLYLISNGRIYSALEGCLLVQEFSKQPWIKFLRKKTSETRSLLNKAQITNFLQGILNENINIEDNKFINNEFRNCYGENWTILHFSIQKIIKGTRQRRDLVI
ncbi:hypothetical protein C2G38_248791 [Gigaspora rosea]|uniref:Uncharacterized protein n=1 Tax=Gigaspora rosea TaxID=44941 RepID=A0A397UHW0_9GLOM|nr:hypothetical protein C2G38_248791 [Gigaspora rosea]